MNAVRVIVTVDPFGRDVIFTSEPMDPYWADLLLMELSRGPLKVVRAKVVPAEEAE